MPEDCYVRNHTERAPSVPILWSGGDGRGSDEVDDVVTLIEIHHTPDEILAYVHGAARRAGWCLLFRDDDQANGALAVVCELEMLAQGARSLTSSRLV